MSKAKLFPGNDGGSIYFRCPGCGFGHGVPLGGKVCWEFDGNLDNPTITPSIGRKPVPGSPLCHSQITAGMIYFHPESDHPLAGQTVPLPELDI